MKLKLIALGVSAALSLGIAGLHAEGPDHQRGEHRRGFGGPGGPGGDPLEHLTKELDLTADQQAKVAPIVEQAKPQIEAIRKEAMEKVRGVMENAGAQIRPLLTPEQQTKFDAVKKAHQDMISAAKEMHQAREK